MAKRDAFGKVTAVAAVVLLALVAWQSGAIEAFGSPESMRASLLSLGPAGYVAFIAAFGVLQAMGIPLMAFVAGAAYTWPNPLAFALSLVGAQLSASLGFGFARYVARDWVSARMPPRLKRIDAKIGERGFWTVFVTRMIFWGNPFIHALFGASKIRFSHYFFGCLAAYAPILALAVWASGYAIDYLRDQPVSRWLPYAAALAILVVGLRLYRSRLRRLREDAEPGADENADTTADAAPPSTRDEAT